MLEFLFRWEVIGIVVGVLATVGVGVLALDDFKIAKVCFGLVAADLAGGMTMWGVTTPLNFKMRGLVVGISFAIIGILWVESLRYVDRKQSAKQTKDTPKELGSGPQPLRSQEQVAAPKDGGTNNLNNPIARPVRRTANNIPTSETSAHVVPAAPLPIVPPAATKSVTRAVEQDPQRRLVFRRLYYQAMAANGVPPNNGYMEQRLEGLGEHFGYSGEDYGQDDLPNDKDAAYQLVDEDLFKKRLVEFKETSILIGYAPERWLLAKQIHEGLLSDEWKAQKRQITDPEALPKTNMVLIRMPKTISAPQRNAVRALLAELVKNGIQINTEYVENGQLQVLIPANVRVGIAASPADYLKADETFFRLQNWPLPGSKEAQFMQAVFGDTSNLDTPKKAYLYWIANRGGIAGDLREARESFGGFLGVTKADPIVSYGTMTQNAERDLVYEGKYVFRDAATNQIKLTPIFQQKLDSVRPKPQ